MVLGYYSRTECRCNTNAFESITGAVGFSTTPSALTLGETETSIPGEFGTVCIKVHVHVLLVIADLRLSEIEMLVNDGSHQIFLLAEFTMQLSRDRRLRRLRTAELCRISAQQEKQ